MTVTIAFDFHNMELLVESYSESNGEKLTVLEFVPVKLEAEEFGKLNWGIMS